ncbi:23S rRNA (adenine(1618)-N(6))-methyltransferase [Chitinimonas naiadis]
MQSKHSNKSQPRTESEKSIGKSGLHPHNPHRSRYDFPALIAVSPELATFVAENAYGDLSIDFANPAAVKALNRALLKFHYQVEYWDIPEQYLCPPIPGRADYLHYLADLLADSAGGEVPQGDGVRVLDIGVGANCIYPLIGHRTFGWDFVGSDIDPEALDSAQAIVDGNAGLADHIALRLQAAPPSILQGVLKPGEWFDACLCNPPFHASLAEATAGSQRKWKNLGKLDAAGAKPVLNFGGHGGELWCDGGEEKFIRRLISESSQVPASCYWFTTLVSKGSSLGALYEVLEQAGVTQHLTQDMSQGQKQSRILAWTFWDQKQRNAYRLMRGG